MISTFPSYMDKDLSPNAMANEALAAGVADRKRRSIADEDTETRHLDKRVNLDSSYKFPVENSKDNFESDESEFGDEKTEAEWQHEKKSRFTSVLQTDPQDDNMDYRDHTIEECHEAVTSMLQNELEKFFRDGLEAFHKCDSLMRELNQSKELCDARGKELLRLQTSEAESKTLVSNLLRAVETSKTDARDAARAAHVEARLRGELTTLRTERDDALAAKTEAVRKSNLLEEEIKLLKDKVNRLIQEKIHVERDSRAALSLARSIDHHVSADTEFYKRKVTELNDIIQAKNTIISEQSHQVEEYRRQIDRNLSQNRLSQMRDPRARS